MDRPIVNGTPGTAWVNDTDKAQYQLVCQFVHTCGFCLQYHMAIGPPWGTPMHPECRCKQFRIAPGETAPHDFVDFREVLKDLPPEQQKAAVGASNFKLLEEGVVKWDDIVTPLRVRTLREVVALQDLTIQEMVDAGVRVDVAETAFAAVNTAEQVLIDEHRAELAAMAEAAGVKQEELTRLLAEVLSDRVVVAAGPEDAITFTKAWEESRLRADIPHADELAAFMVQWVRARKPPPDEQKQR